MFWSLGLMVLFYAGMSGAFSQLSQPINFASWPAAMALTLYDLANTSATALLISGFLLLYLRRPESWLKSLAPYGRMALSNYILQSLIGTFIFYGWGLGLLGVVHDWQTFLLSFTIIFLQIRWSTWWLSRYQYGPLEWIWRCGTYFKHVNFRK